VGLLLSLNHLVLPLDQSPVHGRHHELDFLLDELENLVVLLLLMMVDLDCLCQPELVLEPLVASLHRSYDNPTRDNSVLSPKPVLLVIKR
jgi:hypothetical protein